MLASCPGTGYSGGMRVLLATIQDFPATTPIVRCAVVQRRVADWTRHTIRVYAHAASIAMVRGAGARALDASVAAVKLWWCKTRAGATPFNVKTRSRVASSVIGED